MRQTRFVFAAIPVNVNDVTFALPCIQDTLPGKAPENWEVSLHFVPAPPDMTVVPVIEVKPSATAETFETIAPVQITQALQVGDEYIVVGKVPDRYNGVTLANGWVELTDLRLTDAKGEEVYAQKPSVEGLHDYDWGVQFKAGTVQFPVTFAFDWVRIAPLPDSHAEFEFDIGENPQPSQEWRLYQPIQIGARTITLESIQAEPDGYKFNFTCDPEVTGLSLDISGYTPVGGGGGGAYGLGRFSVSQAYAQLPSGKLHVVLSNLMVAQPQKTWTMQWSPENAPEAASLYGISLKLDRYIPLNDGYYLIGHTEWADERITEASPAGWNLKAYDSSGQEVPLEPESWQDAGLTPEPNQWLYKIYGKNFNAPVTLRATQMDVTFKQPVKISLDLRNTPFQFSDEQLDVPYKTGLIPLEVPGILANAFKATYIKEGDLRGFEIGIEADPALQQLPLNIESGLDINGLSSIAGGGGSNRDEASGLVLSTVLTNARMSFPLVLRADSASINGRWETSWNPPASNSDAKPVTVPQACVTLDQWKQAVGSPSAIPPGLLEKVLVSRGAISPEPSLFISSLDGSFDQGLVFGHGSLSPDGTKLVYSDANNHLYIMDILSQQSKPLANDASDSAPFWSPDGKQIAFLRQTDKGLNIFVMDADGQNVRALTDTTDNHILIGWTAKSRQLIFSTLGQYENRVQALDVDSGAVQSLITTSRPWNNGVSVSPDETQIVYVDRVPGKMAPGIFVSRLDGTEKRLLVQLDTWLAGLPLWSPGGDWLAFLAINTDKMNGTGVPGLVNVDTCQVVPLPNLNGEIRGWVK